MTTTKYVLGLILAGALALSGIVLIGTGIYDATSGDKDVIVLTSRNTLILSDVVDGDSVSQVLEAAKDLDQAPRLSMYAKAKRAVIGSKTPQPIYLFLNTPGGSIQSGMELIEGLNDLRRPVCTITSFAASMGMQIAQGLNGERYVLQHGVMMSHRGTGEFQGQFGGLEPSQAYNRYRFWAQRLKEMDERTVSRTGGKQTLESYQKAYNQELWLTGQEAVDQGYADKMVRFRCDTSLDGANVHNINFMGLPVTYEVDKCPLNTTPHNIRIGLFTNHGSMTLGQFREGRGGFGASCLQAAVLDSTRLCALDTTLSFEKVEGARSKFLDSFENSRSHVVPMTW
jgi:ATP-dependent protease ClpP protease subunit